MGIYWLDICISWAPCYHLASNALFPPPLQKWLQTNRIHKDTHTFVPYVCNSSEMKSR